jgi:hypothetical protein
MKYRYKDTGVIVESDRELDSAMYKPTTEEAPETPEEPKKKTATKRGK